MNLEHAEPAANADQQMTTVTMTVTPEQAQQWLDTMDVQRRLRRNKIVTIKRLVEEGRWRLQPHGIVIDPSGKMIDGQHRCSVIVELQKPLLMRVTFNADPALFKVIDSVQSPKGIADIMQHEGCPAGLSSIVGSMLRYKFRTDRDVSPFVGALTPNNEEAVDLFWSDSPRLLEAAELAQRLKGLTPFIGLLGFYLYLGLCFDEAKTREFAASLASGANLDRGDPALLLRNQWYKDRMNGVKRDQAMVATHIIAALRGHLVGKRMPTWRGVDFKKGEMKSLGIE